MIYSTGVCKPFPPPLVRGDVFLVGLETKYLDIADGNSPLLRGLAQPSTLETKYRDIAATTQLPQESKFLHARQFAHIVTNKNGVRMITDPIFSG